MSPPATRDLPRLPPAQRQLVRGPAAPLAGGLRGNPAAQQRAIGRMSNVYASTTQFTDLGST